MVHGLPLLCIDRVAGGKDNFCKFIFWEGMIRINKRSIWFVIVPVLLFAMLAERISTNGLIRFDGWVYREAVKHMTPFLTSVFKAITHLGDPVFVTAFCSVLFLLPSSRKTIALPVSCAVILSAVLNTFLKQMFARNRPDGLRLIYATGYSFPSGHAMINAALYMMLILMIFRYRHHLLSKIILTFLCAALVGLIGFSRIYLGVHYAGDVLGGWLLGLAVSFMIYLLWKNGQPLRYNSKIGSERM